MMSESDVTGKQILMNNIIFSPYQYLLSVILNFLKMDDVLWRCSADSAVLFVICEIDCNLYIFIKG